MRSQHENLVRTMLWFLADNNTEVSSQANGISSIKTKPRVWIVAGFHTGRAIVASFFDTAVRMGLVIESIYERDLNSMSPDGREVRRDWVRVREGETSENRRWCVVAILKGGP